MKQGLLILAQMCVRGNTHARRDHRSRSLRQDTLVKNWFTQRSHMTQRRSMLTQREYLAQSYEHIFSSELRWIPSADDTTGTRGTRDIVVSQRSDQPVFIMCISGCCLGWIPLWYLTGLLTWITQRFIIFSPDNAMMARAITRVIVVDR